MGVNGMLTAGEVLLQWRLPRGFNFRLMDYPLGFSPVQLLSLKMQLLSLKDELN